MTASSPLLIPSALQKFVGAAGVMHWVIDCETTGLDPKTDRIISLGMVEVKNGRIGQSREWFFNPGNVPISQEALQVHGITEEFLRDKPAIKSALPEILGLLHEALVGAHHLNFDMGFLKAETKRNNFPSPEAFIAGTFDTMEMSKEKWPGKVASLDGLCSRLGIPTAHRVKHGALMDAMLCAEAFVQMSRQQWSLLDGVDVVSANDEIAAPPIDASSMIVLRASEEEEATHAAYLTAMRSETGTPPIWEVGEDQESTESAAPSFG